MKSFFATHRVLLIVTLAFIGFLLLYLPSELIEKYAIVSQLGPFWSRVYLITVTLGLSTLTISSGWIIWTLVRNSRQRRRARAQRKRNPSEMSSEQLAAETQVNLDTITELQKDAAEQTDPQLQRLLAKREAQQLEIVAFGTISSGKSSLMNMLAGREVFSTDLRGGTTLQSNEVPWPGHDRVTLVDTPGLGEVDGVERTSDAADAAEDADLVLLVVDGPLRDTEFKLLQQLHTMEKRVLICLNKEDWYSDADRGALIEQIQEQTDGIVRPSDVVAVRSRSTQRRRVRIHADGREREEFVDVDPEIQPLADRMLRIVRKDGRDLLMANLLLQSRGLMDESKSRVRDALDQRAWQIVDQYMWGAGGAAALSPVPLVDLAAGCAISTKMVLDLARVYRQDIDLQAASKLLGEQGKNLLAVLGTTAATPAIAAGVASLLKTVPGIGTITGGALQGIVQALVTRWIGAVFIEYFKHEMKPPAGGMAELARQQWQRITSVDELRKLVTTARRHWQPEHDSEEEA